MMTPGDIDKLQKECELQEENERQFGGILSEKRNK